ncbi:MAG: Rieske 2Fe-2S domain-containing protein [Anaerolineae bacterium]|nr:Rieske 2Fe-2S domain-containing protein [Anaerolineae bacterium]
MSDHANNEMPRRDFLGVAWGGMTLLAALGSGYVGLRYLTSQVEDSGFGTVITAGLVEDFPPNSVTAFNNGRFYLVRREDGGFLALYHKCTHLACVVLWHEGEGQFYCPCHGSRFEADGKVLNRPATRSLHRFPVTIEGGDVLVDTGTTITDEEIGPDEIAYPPEAGA